MLFGLVLFALIGISIVLSFAGPNDAQEEKNRRTEQALARAKEALVGFAVGDVITSANRLGALPCPDTDDDGSAEISCGDGAGSLPASRLGRLPWKTLGLPDLRDGDGERLWYAVSNAFKNNVPPPCSAPGQSTCLNSDSRGTIHLHAASGGIVHDGANPNACQPSGAIAVVIAPGSILNRWGSATAQNRDPVTIDPTDPQKKAVNYLDMADPDGAGAAPTIDNAVNAERFLNGPVYDSAGNVIVNDRILAIGYQDLIPLLEGRVAREVSICLRDYSADMTSGGKGRYPWAVHMSTISTFGAYDDRQTGVRFGRVPDPPFSQSSIDSGGAMGTTWTGTNCRIGPSFGWWTHWKEHVFYAVADAYKPDPVGAPGCGTTGTCLQVMPETAAGRRYVVMVSGRRMTPAVCAQPRSTITERTTIPNYLEGENVDGDVFVTQRSSATFNDVVVFQ